MDKFVIRTPRPKYVPPQREEPKYRQLVIESLKKVTNISQVKKWAAQLDDQNCPVDEQLTILRELDTVFMSKEVLLKSGIGLCVNRLRKRTSSDSDPAAGDESVQQVGELVAGLLKKWRQGFHAERDREEAREEREKKEPPMFLLGSKGRNRTCKVFYQRLIGGLSHTMERDDRAFEVARQLERMLLKKYGGPTPDYSDHARRLLAALSEHSEALRGGSLSCEELIRRVKEQEEEREHLSAEKKAVG